MLHEGLVQFPLLDLEKKVDLIDNTKEFSKNDYTKCDVKISILNIGTELTSGQITNTNASWISKKLNEFGLKTNSQVTVPDDHFTITEYFKQLSQTSDLIFITGGLGPTSDDFTRITISKSLSLELVWSPIAWDWITKRLTERQIDIKENQKQQCFFPDGSYILSNANGTAFGFAVNSLGKKVFCLPGPPREISAIWDDHVDPWLKKSQSNLVPWQTDIWEILGIPESEIANQIENNLKNCPLEIGYRVHHPYVDFKLSYFTNENYSQWTRRADELLSKYNPRKNKIGIPSDFLNNLKVAHSANPQIKQLSFTEILGHSFLFNRIASLLRKDFFNSEIAVQFNTTLISKSFGCENVELNSIDTKDDIVSLESFKISKKSLDIKSLTKISFEIHLSSALNSVNGMADSDYVAICILGFRKKIKIYQVFNKTFPALSLEERNHQIAIEKALLFWTEILKEIGDNV